VLYIGVAMELRHFRYFVAVAEELHFGRAAARVHIAQPPLSQQIRQLEQELGVVLFHRTKRRVELAPAGRALLEHARQILEETERAKRAAQRAGRGETGRLAIGFQASADLDLLPRVLRLWRARFPDVEVDLQALLTGAQIDALCHGRIHVGFVRGPIDETGLVVESIQREPMVAVLPEAHRLARRRRVRLADLATETMILFPRPTAPGYFDLIMGACRRAGFTPRLLHPGSMQTNLGLVSAGLGVSLMPASIRNLQRTGVVHRPLAPPVPQVELAMVHPRDEPSAVVAAFLATVREVAQPASTRRASSPNGRGRRVPASTSTSTLSPSATSRPSPPSKR
jgi:DNA-binding transcriptional LysR family regulator